MITSERKTEIEALVLAVHNKSEEYQMSHVTFACDYILHNMIVEKKRQKEEDAEGQWYLWVTQKDEAALERFRELKEEIDALSKGSHIYIEYYRPKYYEIARTVVLEDHLLIEIPESLGQKCLPVNGQYNSDALHKLRRVMAHEIGHLLLHFPYLKDSLLGTKSLSKEQDEEADYFRDMLLGLRNDRRIKLIRQKVYII